MHLILIRFHAQSCVTTAKLEALVDKRECSRGVVGGGSRSLGLLHQLQIGDLVHIRA